MPRDIDSAFLTAAAAEPKRPFQTIEARFDSGTRYFWDGPADRELLPGVTYEGGKMISVEQLRLNLAAAASRVAVTVSAQVTADLATALAEVFYGRRVLLGRGFFSEGSGVVGGFHLFVDGEMVETSVRQETDHTVTWRTVVQVGSSRGRDVVGARRTAQNQRALARYLHDDPNYVDNGFRQVAKIRARPLVWPAGGWVPPDMKG